MSRYRDMILRDSRRVLALGAWVAMAVIMPQPALPAAQPASFLDGIHRQTTLSSTVPDNGDQNPYAIVVAPVSAGSVQANDVLITNFNDAGNLQGLGTTIVNYNPTTKKLTTFAALPRDLPGCPGGVGLSTAMTMLKTGWVIVGSAPSADGTTATRGAGCLIILDVNGKVAGTIVGDKINMPWGNMAVIDETGGQAAGGRRSDRHRQRLRLAAEQRCVPHRANRTRAWPQRYALRLGCDRQPDQRDLGRHDPRPQRRGRPDHHQGRPVANAAGDGDGAKRPSSGR
jgi:hypothetical protein